MLRKLLCIILYFTCSNTYAQDKEAECRHIIREGDRYMAQFKQEKALVKYLQAIALAKQLDDNHYALGIALLGAGQALWYEGNFAAAIDTITLAVADLRKQPDAYHLTNALRVLSNIYDEQGNYEKAFETASEAMILSDKQHEDLQSIILTSVQMGNLYRSMKDYATALMYYRKGDALQASQGTYEYRELHTNMGRLYAETQQFDSALYNYRLALPKHPAPKNVNLRIGECYILMNDYSKAYDYLARVYVEAKAINDADKQVPAMIGLGKIYSKGRQLDSAFFMAQGALDIATQKGAKQNKRDACLLLSSIYEENKDVANALLYYKRYTTLKDSVISEQFKGQLYSFKRKTDTERLLVLQTEKNFLKGLIITVSCLGLFIILYLVLRYKNEKLQLKQRSAELEMQALRAQMNPHFIFNCLSAINHFVLNGETDKASDYLTRFSRLIRLVLVNSEKNSITLEEELTMLRLYLDMEKLRFKDAFDYHIGYDANIYPSMITVPSFILQPFCENAIWHGMLHNEGPGKLDIDFVLQQNMLVCTIADNGIGREKAAEIKTQSTEKQSSYGHKLTNERLSLFNTGTAKNASFVIEDIKDAKGLIVGTRVTLRINNKVSV